MLISLKTCVLFVGTLSISALCTIGTDRNGKSERFHSYAEIPQVRNRNSDQENFSSWGTCQILFEQLICSFKQFLLLILAI